MQIKTLAILGATGLLGQALSKECERRSIRVTHVARHGADVELDICQDAELEEFLRGGNFDVVVNCCAIVNHAFCDANPEVAYQTNARPSAIIAGLANELGFKYVYISTDGYFSGDGDRKHDEYAPICLLNEYARTKYAGEVYAAIDPTALVLRTNIVGFRGKKDQPTFVEWVIEALKSQQPMSLFVDYYTSSISVAQFSVALLDLVDRDAVGTINVASREVSSKASFIRAIAETFGYSLANASQGSVAALSSKRADSLGLDVSKAERILGYKLPSLAEVVAQLKKDYHD